MLSQSTEVVVKRLEIGFSVLFGPTVGVVGARQSLPRLGIVLNVLARVGDKSESVAEGVESIVANGGVEYVFAESELVGVDAQLVEQGGGEVGLTTQCLDETGFADGAARPEHRNAVTQNLVILNALGVVGKGVIGHSDDEEVVPCWCVFQSVDETADATIGIGNTVQVGVVEMMVFHVERLMATQREHGMEEGFVRWAGDLVEEVIEHHMIGHTPLGEAVGEGEVGIAHDILKSAGSKESAHVGEVDVATVSETEFVALLL